MAPARRPVGEGARGVWVALELTRAGHPGLQDDWHGCLDGPQDFCNTAAHLISNKAREFTHRLGNNIKAAQYWTEEELIDELRHLGWQCDGSPLPSMD